LLALHKAALEVEIDGIWGRADFFWQELRNELRILWNRTPVWEEAVASVARQEEIECDCSAIELRNRLLDEVFLETHYAFYLSLSQDVEKPSSSDRAFVHVEAIEQLLDHSSLSPDEKRAAYGPLFEARIAACREAGKWDQAVTFATRLASRFSEDLEYQDLLVYTEHRRTMNSLSNHDGESNNLADARALERGIQRQEALRRLYPSNSSLFESLAVLHHLRAVKLANGNLVADALLEVEKSLAFQPGEEAVEKTRGQLVEMMQALQIHVRALEAEVARRPNTHLNAKGMQLRDQARQGFRPAQSFRESPAVQQIRQALALAHVRTLWKRVGLPVPAEAWDEQAFALEQALGRIVSHPPQEPSELAITWRKAAQPDPLLVSLDPQPIEAFLRRHLFGEEEEKQQVASPAPAPLPVRSRERRPGGEPATYWLFSRQNPWIKAMAAMAIILVLAAGALTFRDLRNRHARNLAWNGLQEASRNRNDLGVVIASEAFFATLTPPGGDILREAQARSLYSEALVRWFLRIPGAPDAEALQHLKRYRSFLATHPEEAQP